MTIADHNYQSFITLTQVVVGTTGVIYIECVESTYERQFNIDTRTVNGVALLIV